MSPSRYYCVIIVRMRCSVSVMFVLLPCYYVIIVLLLCYYGGDVLFSCYYQCYYSIMMLLLCYHCVFCIVVM